MTTLRDLNRAVQSAEFPSQEWAQAVREMLNEVAERMEPAATGDIECTRHDYDSAGHCVECGHAWWQRPEPASEGGKTRHCLYCEAEMKPGEQHVFKGDCTQKIVHGIHAEKFACPGCGAAVRYPHEHMPDGGSLADKGSFQCPPASEPAKVECPQCRQKVTFEKAHRLFDGSGGYTCERKPAQPEPAVNSAQAINARAEEAFVKAVRPEPVAAEMPEAVLVNTWQLEELLKYADLAEVSIRTGFAPPSFLGVDLPYLLRNAIAAVRAQAAEAGIKLPKVRSALMWMAASYGGQSEGFKMANHGLDELDAAEGRK